MILFLPRWEISMDFWKWDGQNCTTLMDGWMDPKYLRCVYTTQVGAEWTLHDGQTWWWASENKGWAKSQYKTFYFMNTGEFSLKSRLLRSKGIGHLHPLSPWGKRHSEKTLSLSPGTPASTSLFTSCSRWSTSFLSFSNSKLWESNTNRNGLYTHTIRV